MPHQCVHCGKIYEIPSNEIIQGCECGSHFFFFIKKEQFDSLKDGKMPLSLEGMDKTQVEKDVREIIGAEEEEIPVVLDLESVRVKGPGKFELDIVKIFNKRRPLVYKIEEGKYIIDLASTLKRSLEKKNEDKKEKDGY